MRKMKTNQINDLLIIVAGVSSAFRKPVLGTPANKINEAI